MSQRELPDLQAKYYDWCSGHIAEYLLGLPPEDVQPLLERNEGGGADSLDFLSSPHPQAQLLIHTAYRTLGLPPFERWAEQYRADPEAYEKELVGFSRPLASGTSRPGGASSFSPPR